MPAPAMLALHASHAGVWLAEGEAARPLDRREAVRIAANAPLVLLNAPLAGQRLGYPDLSGLDLLELFAFVYPARFAVPTAKGLCDVLGLPVPDDEAGTAPALLRIATRLVDALGRSDWAEREGAHGVAQALARARWPWTHLVRDRLPPPARGERSLFLRLPEWEDAPPPPPPRTTVLTEAEVLDRLDRLTGNGAERRQGQRDYALAASETFRPRERRDEPRFVIGQAGTGIGKTLGYLAPTVEWAERSGGTVWVSTYTKALQRQLDAETARAYPDRDARAAQVVIRKGRENYLCLLNLEDAVQGGFAGRAAILAQLVARWAAYTKDGDMAGGDLPGWLPSLFRRSGATALTDRRGECVYAGCPHYRRCFIERAARASQQARVVVANHALVMVNAARGREAANRPTRLIFDEGHHLFDAADSTFATALTGQESIELRRWLVGPENAHRGRRRGLAARLADVVSYDEAGAVAVETARAAALQLPADGWLQRVAEGQPHGAIETLLSAVRATVYARATGEEAGYGLETEVAALDGPLIEAAAAASASLEALLKPMAALGGRLEALLDEAPDWLDSPARARVEGAVASLGWRRDTVAAWLSLLGRWGGPADPDFVDWLAVERIDGREWDIGCHRRWLDPTRPLAETVLKPAHGVLVTSATLKGDEDWDGALARVGATHLQHAPVLFAAPSPFDYPNIAQVLIVTDVPRGDAAALANAYARLIAASQGGTLGLFTAIKRLRAVHARLADRLARDGLPLYAQHVDPIDTGTLVDIFRDDPHASLLGTDALRDGVDVPGHSLRTVILEGVPWPKPTVLHAARRAASLRQGQGERAGTAYDDDAIRARLAQGFGRLIRRADDRGSFIILSAAVPSRLLSAFPAGVPIRRVTLDEAAAAVTRFQSTPSHARADAAGRVGA